MVHYILREEAYEGHTEFYQYSKGVRIVYNRKTKQFEEFKFNGKEITEDMILKIALQAYHYSNFSDFFGIDINEVIKNKKPRMVITSCFAIFEELLVSSNLLDSKVEGRLVIKE